MRPLLSLAISFIFTLFTITTSLEAQCDNDTIPPSAIAVNLSTAVLETTQQVELYAIDFIFFKSDDCSPEDSLRYTFSPTSPDSDYNYKEEYRSSTMLFDCHDEVNSPLVIKVYVWDLSGNVTYSSVSLTIVSNISTICQGCDMDTIPPEAVILEEIIWVFPVDVDSIEIWASNFVWSASDNCTASDLLKKSFTPISPWEDPSSSVMFFDCYDAMNSPISVNIYVWDKDGNFIVGDALVNLQTQSGQDCKMNFRDVGGQVINLHEEPIEGATIYLERESGAILDSTITDEFGNYSFFTNPNNKYLRVKYLDDSNPDVTFLDLIAIQKYLLGLNIFSTPQQLASDINADGKIKVDDLRIMRKIVLGIIDPDENISKEWHFAGQNQNAGNYSIMNNNRILIGGIEGPTIVGYRVGDLK